MSSCISVKDIHQRLWQRRFRRHGKGQPHGVTGGRVGVLSKDHDAGVLGLGEFKRLEAVWGGRQDAAGLGAKGGVDAAANASEKKGQVGPVTEILGQVSHPR